VFVTYTYCNSPIYLINSPKVKVTAVNVHLWYKHNLANVTPFTDANFMNDCLLQNMLNVNRRLLQFLGITDSLLSTAALFSIFCSHRIQT